MYPGTAPTLAFSGEDMFNIVLVEPEIPQNTGNIARTCAITGAVLHLVRPLGFDISDKAVKRAGLDYWKLVDIRVYRNIRHFFEVNGDADIWLMTAKAPKCYTEAKFNDGCYLLFGRETRGLDDDIRSRYPDRCLRIPMRDTLRSLNLSNAAAIVLYEALRQWEFEGLRETGEPRSFSWEEL